MAELVGPGVVQGYALDMREYEEAKEKADRALARVNRNSAQVRRYIKDNGPVVCDFNNTDEKMAVYLNGDGHLRHLNMHPLFDHDS